MPAHVIKDETDQYQVVVIIDKDPADLGWYESVYNGPGTIEEKFAKASENVAKARAALLSAFTEKHINRSKLKVLLGRVERSTLRKAYLARVLENRQKESAVF